MSPLCVVHPKSVAWRVVLFFCEVGEHVKMLVPLQMWPISTDNRHEIHEMCATTAIHSTCMAYF